jgi:hypothetical protein
VDNGTDLFSNIINLPNGKFTGLYKALSSEDMIIASYTKIKTNQGNMPTGVDDGTFEGFSLENVKELAASIKKETLVFKPVRRVFSPKKKNKN